MNYLTNELEIIISRSSCRIFKLVAKSFLGALLIMLRFLHNYFDNLTKLFLDLYLTKRMLTLEIEEKGGTEKKRNQFIHQYWLVIDGDQNFFKRL